MCQPRQVMTASPDPAAPVLSDRECAVLGLIAEGRGTREIARELCYSTRTVDYVVRGVTSRFRLRNRTHAIAFAVRAAHSGEGWMPHAVLDRLLSRTVEPGAPAPLTARQTAVLALMAEGYGNAAIAEALSCSEHTVKNTVFALMARLQVRSRAHAVAQGLRAGLI